MSTASNRINKIAVVITITNTFVLFRSNELLDKHRIKSKMRDITQTAFLEMISAKFIAHHRKPKVFYLLLSLYYLSAWHLSPSWEYQFLF